MDNTYNNYLLSNDHLTFEEMTNIHQEILKGCNDSDEDFKELYEDMIKEAISYTNIRVKWNFYSQEVKWERDPLRTRTHNGFISTLMVLKRYMESEDYCIEWSKRLNLDDANTHRKKIGDFANYLTFVVALSTR
ncbi:hypothetical protein [Clostridium paraputrificum]|uniref:Uncharacterized protein n=1 Tax=Clostridium paraputrificum TaxID=29363 RepID=A0A1B8RSR1_9CLOT|nr:hypothetical protein [Clostridium paraputrificum]OBY11868.1 hypothetical protein CP373A1_02790 [Clostridium paraputrificum]